MVTKPAVAQCVDETVPGERLPPRRADGDAIAQRQRLRPQRMHTRCVARREHGEDISSAGPHRATPVPLFTPVDGRARRARRAYRIERGGQAIGHRARSVSCRGDRQAGYAAGELHIRFEVQPADDGVQERVGGSDQRGLTLWNCQRPYPALRV